MLHLNYRFKNNWSSVSCSQVLLKVEGANRKTFVKVIVILCVLEILNDKIQHTT